MYITAINATSDHQFESEQGRVYGKACRAEREEINYEIILQSPKKENDNFQSCK